MCLSNNYKVSIPGLSIYRTMCKQRKRLLRCLIFSSAVATGFAHAATPTAVDDSRRIAINSSLTLNPLTNDYDSDGDAFSIASISAPNNGTASLNRDGSVYYKPNSDFTGTDSFTYEIRENTAAQLTAVATITIQVVDDDIGAFADDDNSTRFGNTMNSVCSRLRKLSDAELGAGRRNLLERCNAMDLMIENDPDSVSPALRRMTPEEAVAQMRVSADSGRAQTRAVDQRLIQLRTGSNVLTVNGIPVDRMETGGAASADQTIWSKVGVFSSIQQEAAEKDVTDLESGYDYKSSSFTLGADYRLDSNKVIGAALGLSRNELEFAQKSGDLDTDILSVIAFGSYHINNYSVDLQVGYADTTFDSRRWINYNEIDNEVDQNLHGSTKGSQWLVNMQLQWQWHKNALTLYPFVAADYLENKVSGYTEQGESGLAMTLGDQSMRQARLSTGVQATYAISRNWGVLIPTAKLTVLSDVGSDYDPVAVRFAYDPDPDNSFLIENDGGGQTYSEISIGASAVFKRGLSVFLQYQQLVGYEHLSLYQVQAGIRYEL